MLFTFLIGPIPQGKRYSWLVKAGNIRITYTILSFHKFSRKSYHLYSTIASLRDAPQPGFATGQSGSSTQNSNPCRNNNNHGNNTADRVVNHPKLDVTISISDLQAIQLGIIYLDKATQQNYVIAIDPNLS